MPPSIPAGSTVRHRPASRVWLGGLVSAALAVAAGVLLHRYTAGAGLVRTSYDLLTVARHDLGRLLGRDGTPGGAVLVVLDEESHRRLEQPFNQPWDRRVHARLLDRLTAAGARAVVFDIVFSDPREDDEPGDAAFIAAVRRHGRVVLAADVAPTGPRTKETIPPFPALRDAAAGIGSAEVIADRDLMVREHTPPDPLPSLSWAAAEAAQAAVARREDPGARRRWMNYYGPPGSVAGMSYHEALDPALMPDEVFRDQVVFVGARLKTKFSGERKDEFRTPFSFWEQDAPFVPGVEIQAMAYLNLARQDWLRRWPPGAEALVLVLTGLAFGFGLAKWRPLTATLAAAGGVLAVAALACGLMATRLTWFPWLLIVMQAGIALLCSVVHNSIQLYVQKRLFEYTLSLYLSPKLVRKFARDPEFLKPGGEKQVLSILFTDIASFTTHSEGLEPDELAVVMNAYFQTAVNECIHTTDGTVVKYIGDAIFAFWNAPEQHADHELRACQAVLKFQALPPLTVNGRPVITRLGLHTGVAMVGNFGSTERIDYTALGDSINLASRIEGLNKHLGTTALISDATHAGTGGQVVTRCLGAFRLKGFEKSIGVHELVSGLEAAEASRAWREAFAAALADFQKREFAAAAAGFRRVLELRPNDGPAAFFLQRVAEFQANPPPAGWAGEIELSEK